MSGLADRTVMITGASRGLGEALARQFARAGARVSICARNGDRLEEIADSVRRDGGVCLTAALDVTDETAVGEWAQSTERTLGCPDVLINNASLLGPRVPLSTYPLDRWREVIDVNLTGALIVSAAVIPLMRSARGGSIINVSSGAAHGEREEWGAYAVSKAALERLSFNLATELDGSGVRVNVVDPGAMRTEMRAAAYPKEDPLTLKTPLETTGVFLWLAGDAAIAITGRRFSADEFRTP
ncbi:MAG TPA: SDR family NAD(P)-dependent oxidoreductase [Longimicrobiaceae bacterium]|nr:SDR family NAD(P)-dependent oxidoreductase [Longimicrobiaceae bacterium]